jgi:hypothetical protein
VLDAICDPSALGQSAKLLRLGGRHGERLFAEHVFAGFERCPAHGIVQTVGCQDMDRVNGRIAKQRPIVARRTIDAEAGSNPRAFSSLDAATAAISTLPRRRRFSACTFPMKPSPISATEMFFITKPVSRADNPMCS